MIGQIVNVFHKMKACVKEVLSYLEGQDFLSIDQIDLDISKFWEVQLGLFGILNLATLILANSPAKTFLVRPLLFHVPIFHHSMRGFPTRITYSAQNLI